MHESGKWAAERGERRAEIGERGAGSGERRAGSGERRKESGERRAESILGCTGVAALVHGDREWSTEVPDIVVSKYRTRSGR